MAGILLQYLLVDDVAAAVVEMDVSKETNGEIDVIELIVPVPLLSAAMRRVFVLALASVAASATPVVPFFLAVP